MLYVYWNEIVEFFCGYFYIFFILERFENDQTEKKNKPEMVLSVL